MQIKVEDRSDVTICYISGEIDINTAPQIKKGFDKIIAGKKKKVLVNLKDASYIDSSGLATFVELLKNARKYGGALKITNLSSKIKSLFEITKLDKLFDISADEKTGMEGFPQA